MDRDDFNWIEIQTGIKTNEEDIKFCVYCGEKLSDATYLCEDFKSNKKDTKSITVPVFVLKLCLDCNKQWIYTNIKIKQNFRKPYMLLEEFMDLKQEDHIFDILFYIEKNYIFDKNVFNNIKHDFSEIKNNDEIFEKVLPKYFSIEGVNNG